MIRQYINQVVRGERLTEAEMTEAMEALLSDQVKPSQMAAFLLALRMRGETPEEIAAAARVVRRHTARISIPNGVVVLDRDEINLDEETVTKTCSLNGGDTRIFNISTATALVAAGAGLKVAKSGARTESTFCGSANVVSALGVNLDLTLTEVERCIEQVGIGFLYAHLFHTPLAAPTQVREDIGIRTIFNIIAPLLNPADGQAQVIGVYSPDRTELMSKALQLLGCPDAMAIYGLDTLDEMSITGPTKISHLKNGTIDTFDLTPEDVGLTRTHPAAISGGNAEDNAAIIRQVIDGVPGPRRDVVTLNAAAAFLVSGRARDWKEGLEIARDSIDSGQAKNKLDELISFTANCGVYQHKELG